MSLDEPIALGGDDARGARGWPGADPHWTSSAKSGVGTAMDARSHIWFTVSHGVVNELYFDRIDRANTRDIGLIITAGEAEGEAGFFSMESRDTWSKLELIGPGIPGYRVLNTCKEKRYRISKSIITDPERSVLVQRVRFEPLVGSLNDYRIFAILTPHIGNQGRHNDAWTGGYKGVRMLFGRRQGTYLAFACDPEWQEMSCGYVGVSDGLDQLRATKRLTESYTLARDGNVSLIGQIDLASLREGTAVGSTEFVIAVGFGGTAAEAAQNVRITLTSPFDRIEEQYLEGWKDIHRSTAVPAAAGASAEPEISRRKAAHEVRADRIDSAADRLDGRLADLESPELMDLYRMSTALIAVHEDKRAQGGIIASLSVPWGESRGDHEMGGYHLVWPRDLVEAAGALIANGQPAAAHRALRFLISTQEDDGHWPQNMWLDGRAYWHAIQMDETAFPILLADMLRREGELGALDPWPMVKRAAGFLVRYGPVTVQDRWEEDGGYSPFTLAVEIAALLAAADFADAANEARIAEIFRDTADFWNDSIERWTYLTGTDLCDQLQVPGYYARITPAETADAISPSGGFVPIKNRPEASGNRYAHVVSPDALALVRFGLRPADDPKVLSTLTVIDAILRRETATGPIWYRYNGDSYGEHDDGSPFDRTGVGRGWPLLAGERGHYELAAGRWGEALKLLRVMRAQASDGGMLPEQVWDREDIPEKELFNGRPTGSAMPLVWAHAEYIKLYRSLEIERVFDTPPQTVERYIKKQKSARYAMWTYHHRIRSIKQGKVLRIQIPRPAMIRWSSDDWTTSSEENTGDSGLGFWMADLTSDLLEVGREIRCRFRWADEEEDGGVDYRISIV